MTPEEAEREYEQAEAIPITDLEIKTIALSVLGRENRSLRIEIERLEAENARLRAALIDITGHSVCCDARHMADKVLKGGES